MRRSLWLAAILLVMAVLAIERRTTLIANSANATDGAQFSADGKLLRPAGYRKWVFLSSGFGMSYSENAAADPDHLMFTNVFVPPADYDYFLSHGRWPDKTMLVVEAYGSQSKGSINLRGHFQTEFMGLDVEVKDASRFADQWAYFAFDTTQPSAQAITPGKNGCWSCHDQDAAVEHTFVQFYPSLLAIAKEKNTLKPGVKLP
jgi:hypothetical protein